MHEGLLKKYKNYIATADVARPKTKFSLGPLSLNLAVGDPNGVESGKFIQIFGKPASGKSTLSLEMIKAWQQANETNEALYVDFERTFDQRYALNVGVDLKRLFIVRADTTEQGMSIIEQAVEEGIKLVVVDSIAAGMPSSELDKDYTDSPKMASNAGLWTRFANRMVGKIDNKDALVVLLNQMRKNFSMMAREEEIPYGGLALQFATSVSIQMQRIKTEDTRITVQAIIKKNKVGAPNTRAEFYIDYGRGINHKADIINLALNAGIVTRSGAWYSYAGEKAQGLDGACEIFPVETIAAQLKEVFA